jgi:periplasmic protein TonB
VFDSKLDERDPPGSTSRADARSWSKGIVASVVLHIMILGLLIGTHVLDGVPVVERHPDQAIDIVSLMAAPARAVTATRASLAQQPAAALTAATATGSIPVSNSPQQPVSVEAPVAQPAAVVASAAPLPIPGDPSAMTPAPAVATAALGSDYRRRLLEHIAAYRRSPAGMTTPGTVYVRFFLARDGEVLSASVVTSSGDTALDRAALDTVRNASPMPTIPPAFPDQLSVVIPIDFGAKKQMGL